RRTSSLAVSSASRRWCPASCVGLCASVAPLLGRRDAWLSHGLTVGVWGFTASQMANPAVGSAGIELNSPTLVWRVLGGEQQAGDIAVPRITTQRKGGDMVPGDLRQEGESGAAARFAPRIGPDDVMEPYGEIGGGLRGG